MQKKIKIGTILLGVGLACVLYWHSQNARVVEAYNADNLIRFHVIANSDSTADQVLKLKVRDKVVQAMTPSFSQVQDVGKARTVVQENLNRIKEVACAEIKKQGQNYPVSVILGNYQFPTKTYGDLTLPAGKYEAVRVVIGEGKGANWWCVMYPPLCFVDLSADLDGELRAEETAGTLASAETKPEPQIHVKFKVVEVLEDSVTRVVRALGKHLVAFTDRENTGD